MNPSTYTSVVEKTANQIASAIQSTPSPLANHDIENLPCMNQIEKILGRLIQLTFNQVCEEQSETLKVEGLVEELSTRLADQIEKAVSVYKEVDDRQTTQQHLQEFLGRFPALRETLMTDVQAAYDGDPACRCKAEIILCYPGLYAIAVYRFAHELYRQGVPLIPRMMAESAHQKTGIDIHPGAIVGNHFFIDHGTGVVIGETTEIGNHVKIYQGVTLGALSFQRDENGTIVKGLKRHPTIEDNVVIYAGATILGGRTTIGKDCVIGSNVWITKSVDPNTTVVMEKPKLRMRTGTSEGLEDDFDGLTNFSI